jgi:uncharacterized membrane protein YeaQ/YmgE (transglycosylase-associated protein family)
MKEVGQRLTLFLRCWSDPRCFLLWRKYRGYTSEWREIMLHILWSIIVGFFAGLVARAVYPGANPMGFIKTTILGIVGSLVGGLIASLIWKPVPGQKFHMGGFLLSIVGAIIVLFVGQRFF